MFTRRELLAKAAGAPLGLTLARMTPAGVRRPATNPTPSGTRVRVDVSLLNFSHPAISGYAKAVEIMKSLSPSDPRSWTFQAAIHGTNANGTNPTWNTCQHSNDWFWPWHRMYLYYFERIVRRLIGSPGWALPYWNYERAGESALPLPFRIPSSPLFDDNRGPGWNAGTASLPSYAVDPSAGFALTQFAGLLGASHSLEITPHSNVHVLLGGDMQAVPTAALDPIFFLHHANIDRLWNLWLAQGGGRTDPPTEAWATKTFTFYDENASAVSLSACDVLRCAQQLDYVYEGEPPQVKEYCLKIHLPWIFTTIVIFVLFGPPLKLAQGTTTTSLNLNAKARSELEGAIARGDRLFLKLDNVEAATQPGALWEVYLGAPPGTKLSPESPFFIGSVSLFGMGVRDEVHKRKAFMPASISLLADRAIAAYGPNAVLPIAFVPSGPLVHGKPSVPQVRSPVRIGKVSLVAVNQRRR